MFINGTFDIVAPNIAVQESEIEGIKSSVFRDDYFSNRVRLMIGGHWHDGEEINDTSHMYYNKSLSK